MTTQINLSTLEQGDMVVFRSNHKVLVLKAEKLKTGLIEVRFYDNDDDTSFRIFYNLFGLCDESKIRERDIIEIIKNPKRWDDRDMRQAYLAGIDAVDFDGDVFDSFGDWFQQYKESKNEANKN